MSKRWSHTPASDAIWKGLRKHDVTSTESAALFGMSPYLTAFELYHRKREKQITEIDMHDRMLWGQRLQDVVATGIAEDNGVRVRRFNKYIRLVQCRMGSSFDFEIVGLVEPWDREETVLREMYRKHGTGNLEIKCVDWLVFRDQWTKNEDGTIEAPPHIEIQTQHQLHVSGRAWTGIGVLVSGHTPIIIARLRYPDVGDSIECSVVDLFQRIKAGTPPEPEYPRDAKVICGLYGHAEPGKVYDGRADVDITALCAAYTEAHKRFTLAKEDKDVAKAKILQKIGDAERVIADGFKISAGLIGPTSYTVEKEGYRNFKVYPQKQKEQKAS